MTTHTARTQLSTNVNGASVNAADREKVGNTPGFPLDDIPGVRPAFAYLAGAFPSAKAHKTYWVVLTTEMADISEAVLKAAVTEYIRTAEYARMPTVGELLKLCRKHRHVYDEEAQTERQIRLDAAQQEEYEAQQEELRRVTRSVPQSDRDEIATRVKTAFNISPDWVTAFQLIYTHLLDTDGPQVGWYSPTALIAAGMCDKLRDGRPTGDPSQQPPQVLVEQITGAFPSRFRAGYDRRLEPLLNPDRVPWEGGL